MKTLLVAALLTLGIGITSAKAIPPCELPWQGYIWGACLDLPGIAPPYGRVFIPVYRDRIIYVHHRRYHRRWYW